ncbi:MAG: hypothetical protein CMJ83_05150 [Planctomycetes bacterium]|nr:hypothetical protein [Planctomycetota bacterium]
MSRAILIACLCLVVVSAVPAQPPPGRILVATRLNGATQAQIVEVLTTSGTVTPFVGGFPSDNLVPTAIAYDRVNGDVIVGLQDTSFARIARLSISGTTITSQILLGTIAGTVTDLEFGPNGSIYAATDGPAGGVSRFPRNGGPATPVLVAPNVTALDIPWAGPQAMAAREIPSGPPELVFFDLISGVVSGTYPMTGMGAVRPTGVVDLPTGAIRQAVTDTQGGLWRFEFLTTAQPWPTTPSLPFGGAAELKMNGSDVLILGGASAPLLRSAQVFGTTLTTIAGPIPGDPVDMALADLPVARLIPLGSPCPANWTSTGVPSIGNAGFQIGVANATPNLAAFLVLGLSDQVWGGISLPLTLVGGCNLLVSGDAVFPTVTNGLGNAILPLPIPADPALAGTIVFGQWGQIDTGLWVTSDAFAAHIWP